MKHNIQMTKKTYYGEIVDQCPICHDMWLDNGQLQRIFKKYKQEYPENYNTRYIMQNLAMQTYLQDKWVLKYYKNACPKCGCQSIRLVDCYGIEIQWCNKCHGIWLNDGQLKQLIHAMNRQSKWYMRIWRFIQKLY